jgi:uncharacterized protein (TIGR02246 family)
VNEMLERYAAAIGAKDVEAFLALYADDVRNFDLWSEWSYDGKAALRAMVTEWFGSLAEGGVEVEFDDVREVKGEDVTALSAFVTYRGLSPAGEVLRWMNNRLTWILRKDADGAWQVVHEHTSAPAGDEGKVTLQR